MENKGSPVAAALLAVMKSDLYVQKAGINREQNYRYASETDFLEAVRPKLAAAGVAVIPSYEIMDTHEGQTKAGTPNTRITLAGTFTFIHAESGDRLDVVTIGQGVDTQDKAAYKAMTGALKYALRQTFLIETGDDPEKDTTEPPARPSAPYPAIRPPAETGARPAAPPAPAASAGGSPALHVQFLDQATGEKADKNGVMRQWVRFTAKFSDGTKASTFDTKHGEVLAEAKAKALPVHIKTEQKGQFVNLVYVALAGYEGARDNMNPADQDGPPDDEAVPS